MHKIDWCKNWVTGAVALITIPVFADTTTNDDTDVLSASFTGNHSKLWPDYRLPVELEHTTTADSDEDIYGKIIEIPVSKRIVFKFGKPRKVLLY